MLSVRLKKTSLLLSCILFISVTTMQFCHHSKKDDPVAGYTDTGEELSGGATTMFDASSNAFSFAAPNLTQTQRNAFASGHSFFNTNWVTAPSSTTLVDGVGPFFNSRSCSGCHSLDGRGMPPTYPGEELDGLLFRLSIPGADAHGGPLGDPEYGNQLSNNAILGVTREGTVRIDYITTIGFYADGNNYELRTPVYTFEDPGYGDLSTVMYSPRLAQQLPGLGLLEAITEADLIKLADPYDANGDSISGRPNYVWNFQTNATQIGRFGWKANQPTLFQQTAGAALGDMGLTTSLFPNENLTGQQIALYSNLPNGGTPEMSDNILNQMVLYCQTLAVPARRNWTDPQVLRGKELFTQAKCASCHVPYFETGTHDVAALSNQQIRPYTDLLLHDMGAGLADNRPDYLATGSEWRTPPLWGIGLIQVVNKQRFLMHDGRARTLEEAIIWHGGEGNFSKKAFINMNKTDRDALIAFLESL